MGIIVKDLVSNGGKIDEFVLVVEGNNYIGSAKLKNNFFGKNRKEVVIKLKEAV